RRHHTLVHRRGWHQTLDPHGTYRLRRRGRTWTTQPRHDQQLPPPSDPATATSARAGPAATRAGPGAARAGPGAPHAGPDRPAAARPEGGRPPPGRIDSSEPAFPF
ncbi:MAG: hypothetical protein WEB03_15110, partial [Nitriliruptor sp.]